MRADRVEPVMNLSHSLQLEIQLPISRFGRYGSFLAAPLWNQPLDIFRYPEPRDLERSTMLQEAEEEDRGITIDGF